MYKKISLYSFIKKKKKHIVQYKKFDDAGTLSRIEYNIGTFRLTSTTEGKTRLLADQSCSRFDQQTCSRKIEFTKLPTDLCLVPIDEHTRHTKVKAYDAPPFFGSVMLVTSETSSEIVSTA